MATKQPTVPTPTEPTKNEEFLTRDDAHLVIAPFALEAGKKFSGMSILAQLSDTNDNATMIGDMGHAFTWIRDNAARDIDEFDTYFNTAEFSTVLEFTSAYVAALGELLSSGN
ncbi:MAG: hypothetical protein SPI14_06050 [Arcanobacterium sp.]|nr:hypothetical protein [Arcanobacterium sp.]